jgi:hypothetical protein
MILQRATQAQPSNPGLPSIIQVLPGRRGARGPMKAGCWHPVPSRAWGGGGERGGVGGVGRGGRRVLCSSAEQENSLGPLGWLPGAVQ